MYVICGRENLKNNHKSALLLLVVLSSTDQPSDLSVLRLSTVASRLRLYVRCDQIFQDPGRGTVLPVERIVRNRYPVNL